MSFIITSLFGAEEERPEHSRTVHDEQDYRVTAYQAAYEAIMEESSDRELEALVTMGDRILSKRPDSVHAWGILNDMATERLAGLRGSAPEQSREVRVLQKFTEMTVIANARLKTHETGYRTVRLLREPAGKTALDDVLNGNVAFEDASPLVIANALKRISIELKMSNIANLPPQETNRSVEDFVRDLRDLNVNQRVAYFAFASFLRNIYEQRAVNGMNEDQLIGSMPGNPRADLDIRDPEVQLGFVRQDPSCYEYGINDILGLKNPQELQTLLENLDQIHSRLPALQTAE